MGRAAPFAAEGEAVSAGEPGRRALAIADGGLRERLAARIGPGDGPPEALNLHRPLLVQEAHGAFLRAGAAMHRTNTRAASAAHLAPAGLAERAEAVNNSAVALVRGVIGPHGVVMGALGPPPPGADRGRPPDALLARAYGEQIVYLSDTGVSFLLLEHFERLADAVLVVEAARRASDAPVLAQLRFGRDGRTADGAGADEAARRLLAAGAGALGVGCGPAPGTMAALLAELRGRGVPVSAMPGLATPGGATPYPDAPVLAPTEFADMMAGLLAAGADILGGCCGVTPEHIRALVKRCGATAGAAAVQ